MWHQHNTEYRHNPAMPHSLSATATASIGDEDDERAPTRIISTIPAAYKHLTICNIDADANPRV